MKLSLILALILLEATSALHLHEGPLEQEVPAKLDKEDLGELEPPFPTESKSFQKTEEHSYHYTIVTQTRKFQDAEKLCNSLHRGHLASIHSASNEQKLLSSARSKTDQAQVWIGGIISHTFWVRRCSWVDGSRWNYSNWATGNPPRRFFSSKCVAMSTRDGRWRVINCDTYLPFICQY